MEHKLGSYEEFRKRDEEFRKRGEIFEKETRDYNNYMNEGEKRLKSKIDEFDENWRKGYDDRLKKKIAEDDRLIKIEEDVERRELQTRLGIDPSIDFGIDSRELEYKALGSRKLNDNALGGKKNHRKRTHKTKTKKRHHHRLRKSRRRTR
jgi:hypothetical protein